MSPFLSCALTLGLVNFQGLPQPHVGVSAFTMWPMSETKRLASHALGKTYMTGLARSFTNHFHQSFEIITGCQETQLWLDCKGSGSCCPLCPEVAGRDDRAASGNKNPYRWSCVGFAAPDAAVITPSLASWGTIGSRKWDLRSQATAECLGTLLMSGGW